MYNSSLYTSSLDEEEQRRMNKESISVVKYISETRHFLGQGDDLYLFREEKAHNNVSN